MSLSTPQAQLDKTAWWFLLNTDAPYVQKVSESHFPTLKSGLKCWIPSITSINVQISIQQGSLWQQTLSEEVSAQAAHLILPFSSVSACDWPHYISHRSGRFVTFWIKKPPAAKLFYWSSIAAIAKSLPLFPMFQFQLTILLMLWFTSHHKAPRSSQLQRMWVGGRLWTSIPSCITVYS